VEAGALAARLNELVVVFISIVLQSLPFVLVGVFASAAAQQYLTGQRVARWLPRQPLAAIALGSLAGLAIPVCDCGAIPLARRLTTKGVPLYAAVAFLVAAPVVNPVVLVATAVAFAGNAGVVALRLGMTLSVALALGGLTLALLPGARGALPTFGGQPDPDKIEAAAAPGLGIGQLAARAAAEYVEVMFFLVLGALLTAATQTFVPRAPLQALGGAPVASVAALMPVATVLSICSEADAFVARAFATTFSLGGVLAFMTIGQIVDLRNGLLLLRTFGARVVGLIAVAAYALVFAEGVLINHLLAGP
jgi:uncharacterized protein